MRRIPVVLGVPLLVVAAILIAACAPPPPTQKAVIITSPKSLATVKSPLVVTGTAELSGGNFRLQILDAANHILADQAVQASCTTNCRGTFSATLSFVAVPGTIRLYAYRAAPKTGARVNLGVVYLHIAPPPPPPTPAPSTTTTLASH
jgi:Immunoglobulin-like domain of bacterial spore germination